MLKIILHTVIIYYAMVLSMRIMGKRQLGELQASDIIITMMLSEIATTPITNPKIPIHHALVPIGILIAIEVAMSFLLLKSHKLKRLFYGSPTIIINRGKLMQKEMKQNRLEIDELISELRQKGYSDISDINYAILEENGKLSVFPFVDKAPATPADIGATPSERGIAHVCVIDGKVIVHNLALAGWDEKRLSGELRKRKLSLSDAFLLTVDDEDNVTIIKKEKK